MGKVKMWEVDFENGWKAFVVVASNVNDAIKKAMKLRQFNEKLKDITSVRLIAEEN